MEVEEIRRTNINYWAEKLSRKSLAERCGYNDTVYINQLCTGHGSFGKATARKLERALDLSRGWFDVFHPELEYVHSDKPVLAKERTGLYELGYPLVPLISLLQAGQWDTLGKSFKQSDAESFLPCPKNHSSQAYALRVVGDSMVSPYGRSYPEGSIIFVDPELKSCVNHGDRIIALRDGHDAVTFKQLACDGDTQYLKPLNPTHPPIFESFNIFGKVIGMWTDE